ncbi:hypothetical protein MCP1_140070 [Candidatus Terasakiella magnetica]|nr:hypothetical protein MCP1_140070 [Candidatus Terasakiella magnetica]
MIDPAAFHCQQAAEKILKGLLISAAAKAPRSHDLEALAKQSAALYPDLAEQVGWFSPVTEWAIVTRYPDLGGGLGADGADVEEALQRLRALRQAIESLRPSLNTP